MPPEIVTGISDCCDGHPYLMQLVCKRYVEYGDLPEAIDLVATDPMVSFFFSVDFEMLSPVEQDVLRLSASSSRTSRSLAQRVGVDLERLKGALNNLAQLGYIRRDPTRGYELVNEFFRRWLQEHPRVEPDTASASSKTWPGAARSRPEWLSRVLAQRYALIAQVGEGASGVVFKARDNVLDEVVAVKILHPTYAASSEGLARFRQEILLARDLPHPNIVGTYHLGTADDQTYLTMRWIEGTSLAEHLSRHGAIAPVRVVQLGATLADALAAAHARRVIHRDINPRNILIDERGEPFLTDFGLARLLDAPGFTLSGIFVGTPDYASPEQANLRPLDERSDLYSLGAVLFALSTGTKPFEGNSASEVLEMHRHTPPPDPRSLRREVPPALSQLILRCLHKRPEHRFASAIELRDALRALSSGEPQPLTSPPSKPDDEGDHGDHDNAPHPD